MKQKLTITVDADLLPVAKRYARFRGMSLSSLIEQSLREMAGENTRPSPRVGEAGSGQRSVRMTRGTMRCPGSTSNDTSGYRRAHRRRP